jgi:hypothetical protein
LKINEAAVAELHAQRLLPENLHKRPVLFRFAVTDYWRTDVTIYRFSGGSSWTDQAYAAKETVFLDFDVISLTFSGSFGEVVIPAVSSPIDIIAPITPPLRPESPLDWWGILKILLAVILGVIAAVLVVRVVGWFLKATFGARITANANAKANARVHDKRKRRRK